MKSHMLGEKTRRSTKEKKKVSLFTLKWLDDNFYPCDGVCLPRCILYSHYLNHCGGRSVQAACAATFGKLIRQKFPQVSTRRLGTRGHSKYHYYGVGIKESSLYYETLYSGAGLTRFSGCKFTQEGGFTRKYSLACKLGTALYNFPAASHLIYHEYYQQIETLLVMYKAHCQCILDCVVAGKFHEVSGYLIHFWHRIPEHLLPLISLEEVGLLIASCDISLHNHIVDVLIPSTMQEMPRELLKDINDLATYWESWVHDAMQGLAGSIKKVRADCAHRFSMALKRHSCFLDLAQNLRPVLYDTNLTNQVISEVDELHFDSSTSSFSFEILTEFKEILHRQATVESFVEWLDNMMENKISKYCSGNMKLFGDKAQHFLVDWMKFGHSLMGALTAKQSKFYLPINMIRLLMDEYVMIAIEGQLLDDQNSRVCASASSSAKLQSHQAHPNHSSAVMTPWNSPFPLNADSSPNSCSNTATYQQSTYPSHLPLQSSCNYAETHSIPDWTYNSDRLQIGQFNQPMPSTWCTDPTYTSQGQRSDCWYNSSSVHTYTQSIDSYSRTSSYEDYLPCINHIVPS